MVDNIICKIPTVKLITDIKFKQESMRYDVIPYNEYPIKVQNPELYYMTAQKEQYGKLTKEFKYKLLIDNNFTFSAQNIQYDEIYYDIETFNTDGTHHLPECYHKTTEISMI